MSTYIKNNFILETTLDQEWKEQVELIEYLMDSKNLFITVSCGELDENGTFGSDNKYNLFSFIQHCLILAADRGIEKISFSTIVVQYSYNLNTGIKKRENIGACIINKYGIFPLSKKDVISAYSVCAVTGRKIKKDSNVNYMSFNNLLQELKKTENVTLD